MSCSKWRWTKACDGRPCPGDCDLCGFEGDICQSCKYYIEEKEVCGHPLLDGGLAGDCEYFEEAERWLAK